MSKKTPAAEVNIEDQKFVLIAAPTDTEIGGGEITPIVCAGTDDLFGEITEYILSAYGEEIDEDSAEAIGELVSLMEAGQTITYTVLVQDENEDEVDILVSITRVV